MQGSLREFMLADLLQAVGVSRQHTVIELCGRDGNRRGAIRMKAGQVLSAEHRGHEGKSAFFDMFKRAPDLFHVFRLPDTSAYPSPLGSITKMLFEAADEEVPTQVDVVEPVERSRPAGLAPDATPRPPARAARGSGMLPVSQARRPTAHVVPRVRKGPPTPPPGARRDTGRRPVVVGVASPKGGVGKTTITLNLALSLAEHGLRTTVVDADVNGDLLSALDARGKVDVGAFDLLDRPDEAPRALRKTAVDELQILPARGPRLPVEALARPDLSEAWGGMVSRLRRHGDIVLVDCPAGMFHTTGAILRSCTHVVGVFQAEILASRSFPTFLDALAALPRDERPALAGVVVNMFQGRSDASVEALHDICVDDERHRLFETTIPRSEAFSRANLVGQPLRSAGEEASAIAWLFDMLADEVCRRVGVTRTEERPPGAFLL